MTSPIGVDQWKEYFQSHFSSKSPPPPCRMETIWEQHQRRPQEDPIPLGSHNRRLTKPTPPTSPSIPDISSTFQFLSEESFNNVVSKLLCSLSNGTSSGFDFISAEFLKYARVRVQQEGRQQQKQFRHILLPVLCKFFFRMFQYGSINDSWKVAKISPLFKKGQTSQPIPYRMLAVNSILYRLYSNTLRVFTAKGLAISTRYRLLSLVSIQAEMPCNRCSSSGI